MADNRPSRKLGETRSRSMLLRQRYCCLCRLAYNVLLKRQKLAPPSCEKLIQSVTRRGAHGEQLERPVCFERRDIVLTEEIHLGEDNAMGAAGQFR